MKKEVVYTKIQIDEAFPNISTLTGLAKGLFGGAKAKSPQPQSGADQNQKDKSPAQIDIDTYVADTKVNVDGKTYKLGSSVGWYDISKNPAKSAKEVYANPALLEKIRNAAEKSKKPTQQGTAQQAQADVVQPVSNLQQTIKSSTSDILLPQAILIKSLLTKELGQSFAKILGGLSQEQRKTIMTPVMQYLNTLPNMASQVIAEQTTPFQPRVAGDDTVGMPARSTPDTEQQSALKAKLTSKHASNTKLIGNNLKALQTQTFNNIKTQLNANKVANMLYNSIDKKYGNTKQGMQYIKSLQKNPQAHLDALLVAIQVVLDNVMLIVQYNMPKQEIPKANLPENKVISESQINRWKQLSGILKN